MTWGFEQTILFILLVVVVPNMTFGLSDCYSWRGLVFVPLLVNLRCVILFEVSEMHRESDVNGIASLSIESHRRSYPAPFMPHLCMGALMFYRLGCCHDRVMRSIVYCGRFQPEGVSMGLICGLYM